MRRRPVLAAQLREQLLRSAHELGWSPSEAGLEESLTNAAAMVECVAMLDAIEDPHVPQDLALRDAGRPATAAEDPHNAIIRFCDIAGASAGPLTGVRVGVKDNIPVAGVPMTGGEIRDSPPVPRQDALVVRRLLEAGARITAKTNTAWQFAGAAYGDTRNPHDPRFSAGFSSSGSAAAVAAGLLDAALGTDVGGSVRIPSAWCGTVGMKATNGLVPSSYGLGDHSLNDIGPITASVRDNAALLEAMTGRCGYADAASDGIEGLRIGVVAESTGQKRCTAGVLEAFARATSVLTDAGAELVRCSVPRWDDGAGVLLGLLSLDRVATIEHWLGEDVGVEERIDTALDSSLAHRREEQQQPLTLLRHALGARARELFVKAHNLRVELREQLDSVLSDVDLIVAPTTPAGPFELADPRLTDPAAALLLLKRLTGNTAPFNLGGHPALSVPSGHGDGGLPTALQIAGRHLDEGTVYLAAFAFENEISTRGSDAPRCRARRRGCRRTGA